VSRWRLCPADKRFVDSKGALRLQSFCSLLGLAVIVRLCVDGRQTAVSLSLLHPSMYVCIKYIYWCSASEGGQREIYQKAPICCILRNNLSASSSPMMTIPPPKTPFLASCLRTRSTSRAETASTARRAGCRERR